MYRERDRDRDRQTDRVLTFPLWSERIDFRLNDHSSLHLFNDQIYVTLRPLEPPHPHPRPPPLHWSEKIMRRSRSHVMEDSHDRNHVGHWGSEKGDYKSEYRQDMGCRFVERNADIETYITPWRFSLCTVCVCVCCVVLCVCVCVCVWCGVLCCVVCVCVYVVCVCVFVCVCGVCVCVCVCVVCVCVCVCV